MDNKVTRNFETILPISWTEVDFDGHESTVFYNVIWTGSFGPFKCDDKSDRVYLDYCEGRLLAYDNGWLTHSIQFKLTEVK